VTAVGGEGETFSRKEERMRGEGGGKKTRDPPLGKKILVVFCQGKGGG